MGVYLGSNYSMGLYIGSKQVQRHQDSIVQGAVIDMQLDTAADVPLLPEDLYWKHLNHVPLQAVGIVLKTDNDTEKVELVGKVVVTIKYEEQEGEKGSIKSAQFGLQ